MQQSRTNKNPKQRLKLQPGSSATLRGIKGTQAELATVTWREPQACTLLTTLDSPGLPRPLSPPTILLPSQASKDVLDIGVVTSRFGDGDPELSIAQGSHSCDEACHNPYDESHAHRAGILQHTFGWDEDSRADDVPCEKHRE